MWKFGYDHRNQLVWVEKWQRTGNIEENYGRGAGEVAGDVLLFRIDYKYDAWGNRVERRKQDYNSGGGVTSDVTERYAVDGWDTRPSGQWAASSGQTEPAGMSSVGNEHFNVWADLNVSNQLTVRRVHDGIGVIQH